MVFYMLKGRITQYNTLQCTTLVSTLASGESGGFKFGLTHPSEFKHVFLLVGSIFLPCACSYSVVSGIIHGFRLKSSRGLCHIIPRVVEITSIYFYKLCICLQIGIHCCQW